MELNNNERPILIYFEQEYGNTIDVFHLPNLSTYYISNVKNNDQIGLLRVIKNNECYVNYNDKNHLDFIMNMFNVTRVNVSNSFSKWLLIKFKCNSVEDFKNKLDYEFIHST